MKTRIILNAIPFSIICLMLISSIFTMGCTNKEKDSCCDKKEEFAKLIEMNNLAKAESWLIQELEIDSIGECTTLVSMLLYELIESNPETMNYSFEKLRGNGFLNIEVSNDGNLRIYMWNDETGLYNGGHQHIVQYKTNGEIVCIDFMEAYCPECFESDDYDEFRGFELYTMYLNNQTYYMVEVGHLQAAGWLGCRDISIYTIEKGKLVKQAMFKTSREILSEIGFEYDAASYYYDFIQENDDSIDWLFKYDDKHRIIYVPLVGISESDFIVTDKYLLYQWNGELFKYIGVERGKRK